MTRILLIFLLFMTLFITGCQCANGFGRDLQNLGSWIEQKSS